MDTDIERRLTHQIQWILLVIIVLFAAFTWLTIQVEGFGVSAWLLLAMTLACGVVMAWLSYPTKTVLIIAIAVALLGAGVVFARTDREPSAAAHTIQCARPARTGNATLDSQKQVLYKQCLVLATAHAIWHQRQNTNAAVAGNLRSESSYNNQCWKLRQQDRLLEEERLALPYLFVRVVDCLSHTDP